MASEKVIAAAEAEVKEKAVEYFETNFSDEFGYVTEKKDRILSLKDDDAWVAFQMLHATIRLALWSELTPKAKKYLVDNQVFNTDGSLYH